MEEIPKEIGPYYEHVFVHGFPVCEKCSECPEFPSKHPQFSDEWYMEQAIGIKDVGWVVPEIQVGFCKKCAEEEDVKHNPNAYSKGNRRL